MKKIISWWVLVFRHTESRKMTYGRHTLGEILRRYDHTIKSKRRDEDEDDTTTRPHGTRFTLDFETR